MRVELAPHSKEDEEEGIRLHYQVPPDDWPAFFDVSMQGACRPATPPPPLSVPCYPLTSALSCAVLTLCRPTPTSTW